MGRALRTVRDWLGDHQLTWLSGVRREGAPIADLTAKQVPAPFVLLRGKASAHGRMLIVDLEGSPFGSYVFTGQRRSRWWSI